MVTRTRAAPRPPESHLDASQHFVLVLVLGLGLDGTGDSRSRVCVRSRGHKCGLDIDQHLGIGPDPKSSVSIPISVSTVRPRRRGDRRHGDDGPPERVRDAADLRAGDAQLGVVDDAAGRWASCSHCAAAARTDVVDDAAGRWASCSHCAAAAAARTDVVDDAAGRWASCSHCAAAARTDVVDDARIDEHADEQYDEEEAELLAARTHRHYQHLNKRKASPYERRVPELIPVLCSQPTGDVSHKPGGRLPLLSTRPAVTLATLKRAASSFAAR